MGPASPSTAASPRCARSRGAARPDNAAVSSDPRRLRAVLDAAGYAEPTVLAALGLPRLPDARGMERRMLLHRTRGAVDLLRPFASVGDGLRRTDTAVREWVGLVAYRLTGRTTELFPGP